MAVAYESNLAMDGKELKKRTPSNKSASWVSRQTYDVPNRTQHSEIIEIRIKVLGNCKQPKSNLDCCWNSNTPEHRNWRFFPIFKENTGILLKVHREGEKRNQFSFVCIFLVLDRKL